MSSYHIIGQDHLPTTSTLVIPGRISRAEITVFRKLFAGRPITWLVEEQAPIADDIKLLIQQDQGAMFAREDDPRLLGEKLKSYFAKQGVLIYLPGRSATRAAVPCHIPSQILRVLCQFGLPVLPVAIDVPKEGGLLIEKSVSQPEGVMSIGQEIAAGKATLPLFHERLLLASEEAFSQRHFLKQTLGIMLLKGLKRFSTKAKIRDGTDDSTLGYDKILASAIVLSKVIRRETDQPRVGIVLPPGKAGLIANLAVIFAGKVPVNLNFTASQEAVRSAMRQADLDRFITVDPFVRKFPAFPWPPNRDLILIERILPGLKKKIGLWFVLSKLLPVSLLASHLKLTQKKASDEAVLLFTSGSSGEPKGVSLTHRNVLANVLQFHTRLNCKPGASILGCLPLFHSFGCTVTLWYPIIAGIDLVTYPSPAETKRIAELIHQHKVEIFLSTPTFLRGYMKRVDPEQLSSLKLVVTGAEKLPESFAQAFEEKFSIRPHEGYGLTETSPATNVNLPNVEELPNTALIPSARSGSVGPMLPGMAVRLTNPATEQPIPLDQQGLIWLKGANVFGGYLNNPKKSAEVLHDGWFLTGDVGRMDDDGFLYIEGRISRFSKIGGEMVPHETLEAEITKALGLDQESERKIAIVGVPDAQKGEAIVLLSTVAGVALEQECIDLRYKLMDAGIPSLWCPKRIIPIPEIPILASGKLDIKGCSDLASRA
jgi:acyl-[acyl-carrier-protein]-phospholipid O-acyltransferase/long-chain-fatty-acid--[acyl-carrier-protein] ligase